LRDRLVIPYFRIWNVLYIFVLYAIIVSIFHILEYGIYMTLNPQDAVVMLKFLVAGQKKSWTYAELGEELAMSPSQVFRSVDRSEVARLLDTRSLTPLPGYTLEHPISRPNRANLKEFLIHGVKYAFPVHHGGLIRGIPTAHAAPPLNRQIAESSEPPPVWPDPEGTVRGLEFSPLYKNVPAAARRDPELYELLALVDAIRDGRTREREIAIRELTARIDER
jgi:hypothetical protein